MLRFCSNFGEKNLLVSCFYTPNKSKIGALSAMPNILDLFLLTIWKNDNPKLKYVAMNRLIHPKNDPKVPRRDDGKKYPFLIGQGLFLYFDLVTVPKRLGLGPKFFHLGSIETTIKPKFDIF